MVQGGTIVKWYKTEGDKINYGDDLLDIEVKNNLWSGKPLSERIKTITGTKHVEINDVVLMNDNSQQVTVFHIRIISSDMGILRKIYVKKGEYRDVGSTLALLTTDENESLDEAENVLNQASTFRVIANTIQFE
jgi:multidrug efflux pump subunit AcrA (membrane-fusion protein)